MKRVLGIWWIACALIWFYAAIGRAFTHQSILSVFAALTIAIGCGGLAYCRLSKP